MSKKVFVLGAGFNQFLKKSFGSPNLEAIKNLGFDYPDGHLTDFSPPMSKDFFRYSLVRQFCSLNSLYGVNNKVLEYIENTFNRPRSMLLSSDSNFDLELLFSTVEDQISDAKYNGDREKLNYLEEVRLNLIIAIGDTFFDLEWGMLLKGKDLLMKFGEIIYKTKSDVITFNYDCLVEWAIEQVSGKSGLIKDGAPFFKWDRHSAYRIKFTKIRGMSGFGGYYGAESGRNIEKNFYAKHYNSSPDFSLIKLHGSYNWFKYSNFKRNKDLNFKNFGKLAMAVKLYIKDNKMPQSLENERICFNADWQYGVAPTLDRYRPEPRYSHVLEPIIIPPVSTKEYELRKDIFQQLWKLAKESLLKCEEIIFIGYSFPDTDLYSVKLFMEVLSENKNIAVTMVNPDPLVEKKFRELVNYREIIRRYLDSGEYISDFS